mmetsp:Transcript_18167/g.28756  ORF Transcript_18167/g.28756 Transcript_18167/m.28756 type:complete len:241 (-) Transcript_18167:550-1272(-)
MISALYTDVMRIIFLFFLFSSMFLFVVESFLMFLLVITTTTTNTILHRFRILFIFHKIIIEQLVILKHVAFVDVGQAIAVLLLRRLLKVVDRLKTVSRGLILKMVDERFEFPQTRLVGATLFRVQTLVIKWITSNLHRCCTCISIISISIHCLIHCLIHTLIIFCCLHFHFLSRCIAHFLLRIHLHRMHESLIRFPRLVHQETHRRIFTQQIAYNIHDKNHAMRWGKQRHSRQSLHKRHH